MRLTSGPVLAIVALTAVSACLSARAANAASVDVKVEKDRITVTGSGAGDAGKFAVVFSRAAASIVEWYDLDRDPEMKTNLSARGGTNSYALFQNRAEMMYEGRKIEVYPGRADEFELVESSKVRVIVLMKGSFRTNKGPFPGEKLDNAAVKFTGKHATTRKPPRYATRFTVYPTGRIFIRHVWMLDGLPLSVWNNRMVIATAPLEGTQTINDHPDSISAAGKPISFLLHAAGDVGFSASALLVANRRKFRCRWLGQSMSMKKPDRGWTRSAFLVQEHPVLMRAGEHAWSFMLQLKPNSIRSREAAKLYAVDYAEPLIARFVDGRDGSYPIELEDEQLDGFAEGRGCHVLRLRKGRRIRLNLDTGMHSRFYPVFEIHNWQHEVPRYIVFDGARRLIDKHYCADVSEGTLTIQFLGVLSPGKHTMSFESPPERILLDY